jgi:hypothetical protein
MRSKSRLVRFAANDNKERLWAHLRRALTYADPPTYAVPSRYAVSPAFVFGTTGSGFTGYGGPFSSTFSIAASYP